MCAYYYWGSQGAEILRCLGTSASSKRVTLTLTGHLIDMPCAKGASFLLKPLVHKQLGLSAPPQVRCDAASLGVPCTNCVAFSIECRIPPPKRKKAQTRSKDSDRFVRMSCVC